MAKYINTEMAIEALQKGLDVWFWCGIKKEWSPTHLTILVACEVTNTRFAIGEKPTSPPRKMIEIDGVPMPAPITQEEAGALKDFALLDGAGCATTHDTPRQWKMFFDMGNAFATEADAIAARDARKLILELAMERAK